MQGPTSPTDGAACSVCVRAAACVLVSVALAFPAVGSAQDYGPFECSADANHIDTVLARQRGSVYVGTLQLGYVL